METKFCPRCGRELSVVFFSKSSKSKDGYQPYCKECCSEMNKVNSAKKKAEKEKVKETLREAPAGTAFVLGPDGKKFIRVKKLEEYDVRELCAELKRRGIMWDNMWFKQTIDYNKIEG